MTDKLTRRRDELAEKYKPAPRETMSLDCAFARGFDACAAHLLPIIEEAKEALQVYGKKGNWEYIEGHTNWASNLKIQDCAMYNCGGGAARKALAALEEACGKMEKP